MWNKGWGVKTLFQFDPDCWKLGIHRPKIKNKHLETDFPHSIHWLNGSGRPMESYFKFRGWRSIVRTVGYDWAQMNHYAIKSMDSYAIRKFRGNVNNKKDKYNAAYWSLQDRNEVRDEAALRHAPRRNEIFECLLTDPVLAELHHTAVDVVEARLGEFKKTPQYRTLIDDLKTASEVPITEVEAKPPKARNPEKIAAQMSEIEKKMVVTDKVKTASDTLPPRNAESHPYVEGMIKVGGSGPTRAFSNHGIMLPADPRIFTDAALQAIVEGKFMRNHARRLPGFICGDDSYLEIGAGISFLAALLARQFPAMSITAQEERKPLHAIGRAIWEHNGVTETQTRRLIDSALFHPEDDRHSARGMTELVSRSRCSVLYVNDPQVSAKMVLRAVSADPTWRPRIVIVGPRALAGRSDTTACKSELTKAGYSMPTEQPLAQALTFMFEALADADGNDET